MIERTLAGGSALKVRLVCPDWLSARLPDHVEYGTALPR